MKIRNKYYPYPVLTTYNDDYVGCRFDVDLTFAIDGYDLKLEFSVLLDNNYLLELLRKGVVSIVYHIESSHSRFRNKYETFTDKHCIKIPIAKLKDKVDICCFIVAKKDISNYTNESFNPEYGDNCSFDIEAGCVLAVGSNFTLNIPKIREELKDRPSFIVIAPKEDISDVSVNLDDNEKLKIYLPHETYQFYKQMSNNDSIRKIFVSSIVTPALIYTIEYLKNLANIDELNFYSRIEEAEWLQAIQNILKKPPFEITDFKKWVQESNSLEWVQKLLGSPIVGCVKQLYDLRGIEDED